MDMPEGWPWKWAWAKVGVGIAFSVSFNDAIAYQLGKY